MKDDLDLGELADKAVSPYRDWKRCGIEVEDLRQEALIKGIEASRVENERGYVFAAMKNQIADVLRANDPMGQRGRKHLQTIRSIAESLRQELGHEPDVRMVAYLAGITVEQVRELLAREHRAEALPLEEWDLPSDRTVKTVEEIVLDKADKAIMREAYQAIEPKHQAILIQVMLSGAKPNVAAIGRGMGISRQRAGVLINAARAALKEEYLRRIEGDA